MADTFDANDERGRLSHPTASGSRSGSRSTSRVRQLIDSVTHMSSGQDYAAASAQAAAGTFGADAAAPAGTSEARGRKSGSNSPAGSRSGSRVRELLHKITHMSSGQDYAAQSAEASAGTFGQDAATAPSLNHGATDRVGRSPGNSRPASRSATPAGSRSQSRVREILHKATHLSSGQDYAANSAQGAAGTFGADAPQAPAHPEFK